MNALRFSLIPACRSAAPSKRPQQTKVVLGSRFAPPAAIARHENQNLASAARQFLGQSLTSRNAGAFAELRLRDCSIFYNARPDGELKQLSAVSREHQIARGRGRMPASTGQGRARGFSLLDRRQGAHVGWKSADIRLSHAVGSPSEKSRLKQ